MGLQNYYDSMKYFQQHDGYDFQEKSAKEAKKAALECPAITKVLTKIFDRIVEANSLQKFINDGPGMGLVVDCHDPKYGVALKKSKGPHCNYYNAIVIGSGIVKGLDSEDEIAFVISHEMAHVLQGHSEINWNFSEQHKDMDTKSRAYRRLRKPIVTEQEAQADELGVILMGNAGYSPLKAPQALHNAKKFYIGPKALLVVSDFLFNDGHGSSSIRNERILKASEELGPVATKSLISSDLSLGKMEYDQIHNK